MGVYSKKVYKKDKKGNWKLTLNGLEVVPHNEKFWLRNKDIESSSNLREKTYLIFQSSKSGKSKNVISAITYFGSDEKVERKLLTTSNKISNSHR